MTLTAGIHTLEIATNKALTHDVYVGWSNYDQSNGVHRTKINPHKFSTDEYGRYRTLYGSLSAHNDVMAAIYCQQGINPQDTSSLIGYKRMDLSIDMDEPYSSTVRICRLFLLAMAQKYGADNNYLSTEPITGEQKAFRVAKKRERSRHNVIEIEHYNRSQIYQEKYDKVVVNRLEFRLTGQRMVHIRSAEQLVDKWRELIDDAINPTDFKMLEEALALRVWKKSEEMGLPAKDIVSVFSDWILTKRQIARIYERAGLKPDSGRRRVDAHKLATYTYKEFLAFKEAIFESLDDFVRN